MNKEVYASDGQYLLVKFSTHEKENYLNLLKNMHVIMDSSIVGTDALWNIIISEGEIHYSVYDSDWAYCGDLLVKRIKTATPEIGIDLAEEHRNKGIAGKCIKLIARAIYAERNDIDSFLLRVSSKNPHSKHMIEKLGAIFVGEEDSDVAKMLRTFCDSALREGDMAFYEKYKKLLAELEELDCEKILHYKLMPDSFIR